MPLQAFSLLPVLESIDCQIICFESSGNMLYLGTIDGSIKEYAVEERTNDANDIVYISSFVCQRNLHSKKPVVEIKAASALGRILVLTDGILSVLDSYSLTSISSLPKVKNVSTFCVNENPTVMDPFTLQFCISRKKVLQICILHEDRLSVTKEISTSELSVAMSMDGVFICAASMSQYCVYNIENGTSQDLFPCDMVDTPLVHRIGKEEFLVSGPGNLGMFVTAKGTSERPPIQWSDGVRSIAYYYPYVLTITPTFISVYSLLCQMQQRTLPITGGCLLGNFDGQMYVATESSVLCLMPKPWFSQVKDLLEDGCVEEALALTEHSGGAGMSSDKFIAFSSNIFQRAGFLKLAQEEFDDAQQYFEQGKLDIRELISLFPGYLVKSFSRAQPPLHEMADINQAFHNDPDKIRSAKDFLLRFLVDWRTNQDSFPHRLELDTTLIKLYSELESESLLVFLESGDIECSLDDCISFLQHRNQYFAAATLYRCFDRIEDCLEILVKLLEGEISDAHFGGIKDLVDVIISSKDSNLVFRYADFVLERDPNEGLRLFCETSHLLDHDVSLKYLAKHPSIRKGYLSHLIYVLKVENGKYHTQLSLDYIEGVSVGMKESKSKLLELLNFSTFYDPKIILTKLQEMNLIEEMATVYGLLKQHDKALKLLVEDLKDFEAAERYCINQDPKEEESNLYMTLLKIYLKSSKSHFGEESETEMSPVMSLLEKHAAKLDLKEVLQILPDNWSVSLLSRYLRSALRESAHKSNMSKLEYSMVKSQLMQQQFIYHKLCQDMGPIVINANRICCVCQKGFTECNFVIYPNGVLTHAACAADENVCPLTGTIFKAKSCT